MDIITALSCNLLSPAILFFVLGVIAGKTKVDIHFSDQLDRYLSFYLMIAVGLKGGAALAHISDPSLTQANIILTFLAAMLLGFLIPIFGVLLLRLTTQVDKMTAIALAAHYGSISIITFTAAISFLKVQGVSYQGYMVALAALMEIPAIIAAILLMRLYKIHASKDVLSDRHLLKEIASNTAVFLLLGGVGVGYLTGAPGMEKLGGVFVTPFQCMLALFLLSMGTKVVRKLSYLKGFNLPLALFGVYMPVLACIIALLVSKVLEHDLGTATLFMVLCASASYIAVPAAMKMVLPEAQESIYLTIALVITFPFNIVVGIPCYYSLAALVL